MARHEPLIIYDLYCARTARTASYMTWQRKKKTYLRCYSTLNFLGLPIIISFIHQKESHSSRIYKRTAELQRWPRSVLFAQRSWSLLCARTAPRSWHVQHTIYTSAPNQHQQKIIALYAPCVCVFARVCGVCALCSSYSLNSRWATVTCLCLQNPLGQIKKCQRKNNGTKTKSMKPFLAQVARTAHSITYKMNNWLTLKMNEKKSCEFFFYYYRLKYYCLGDCTDTSCIWSGSM